MSIFDKFKFKNKGKVKDLQEQFANKQICLEDMPKDVLVELLQCAIERIDDKENGEYERDFKDIWWDLECIVDDLFNALQEKVDLDFYE